MTTSRAPVLHAIALRLELLSGLIGSPSGLSESEWLRLLAPLPPVEARAVVLVHLHGLTERDTAERLEVTRARVWQRLQSAYRRLKQSPLAQQLGGREPRKAVAS